MGEIMANDLKISNDGINCCELYFSLINDNLVHNINNILKNDYKICLK